MLFRYNSSMANETEIKRIKSLTDGADGYTDSEISAELQAGVTVREFCYNFWSSKAAEYSSLVNVTESGSTRAMGDLYKNALAISDRFKPLDEQSGSAAGKKRTRAAVRS